jgi:hypothetical protein
MPNLARRRCFDSSRRVNSTVRGLREAYDLVLTLTGFGTYCIYIALLQNPRRSHWRGRFRRKSNMKATMLLLVLGICLVSVGCKGPVEEVKTFLNEKDNLLLQITKTLEANPSEAGVNEARRMFEAKKGDLKAKQDALREKHIEKYGDLVLMRQDNAMYHDKVFLEMRGKFATACASAKSYEQCEPATKKLSALQTDFKELY